MDNKKNTYQHTSWITLAVLCIAVGVFLVFTQRETLVSVYREVIPEKDTQEILPEGHSYADIVNDSRSAETKQVEELIANNDDVVIPQEFLLSVPFTTQAPYANWDMPYQEACEEASALTVHYYYAQKSFTPDIADKEILDLVDFENDFLGFYQDTTAQETASVIAEYFGYRRVDVIDSPTVENIKFHVSQGRPVIVPAAGKLLENDHFRSGGPLYHMLVITGYTQDEFITNDVGTRFGENFRYPIENVMSSMHDWNGGDVEHGAKRIIVIYPNT